jgi:triosephosphate isomerase
MAKPRTSIIAGNWKMNYGPRQASRFAMEILPDMSQIIRNHPQVMSVLCPPAISLGAVREVLDALPTEGIELGAQNMYYEEKGAFTGEIAPDMVRELCTMVILGHSERRTIFGESDGLVNHKTLTALNHNLRPIVCVGENLEQYESGMTQQIIRSQIHTSLAHLPASHNQQIVIAYEPIWAIGSGKAATASQAQEVIHYIRHLYNEMYGDTAAASIRILYGGSVTADNIGEFISGADIDGALVGGASLKVDFVEILRKTAEVVS